MCRSRNRSKLVRMCKKFTSAFTSLHPHSSKPLCTNRSKLVWKSKLTSTFTYKFTFIWFYLYLHKNVLVCRRKLKCVQVCIFFYKQVCFYLYASLHLHIHPSLLLHTSLFLFLLVSIRLLMQVYFYFYIQF